MFCQSLSTGYQLMNEATSIKIEILEKRIGNYSYANNITYTFRTQNFYFEFSKKCKSRKVGRSIFRTLNACIKWRKKSSEIVFGCNREILIWVRGFILCDSVFDVFLMLKCYCQLKFAFNDI